MAPIFMKKSVDALGGTITQSAVNACVMALLWSGVCRVINSVAREAQGPIFTPVAQVGILPMKICPYLTNHISLSNQCVYAALTLDSPTVSKTSSRSERCSFLLFKV